MIPMKGYGLRNIKTKTLVGISTRSNADGECCYETQYLLDLSGDIPWIVTDAINAEWVRKNSTEWYNAGYETPTNEYDPDTLEVVEVKFVITKTNQSIPTWEEYIQRKYNNPKLKSYDPKHVEWVISKDYHYQRYYTLYDLQILIKDEEGTQND